MAEQSRMALQDVVNTPAAAPAAPLKTFQRKAKQPTVGDMKPTKVTPAGNPTATVFPVSGSPPFGSAPSSPPATVSPASVGSAGMAALCRSENMLG